MRSAPISALVILVAAVFGFRAAAAQPELVDRWWPVQKIPKSVIRVSASGVANDMMIQSIAGLAAKTVNEGQGDELVWVETGNASLDEWFSRWRATYPDVAVAGPMNSWELADRFTKNGVIKGYILYKLDTSKRELNAYSADMNLSVNIATSLAPILHAIIVDESIERDAIAHGLKQLADVRNKTQAWCFQNYRDQFNHRMVCTQDPKKPHTRDFSIAHNAFTFYGDAEPATSVMKWLEPLSPILGWNGGDEFKTTELSSRFGHIQTATDWCMNLPVLMAGSEKVESHRANAITFPSASVDWNDRRSAISFVQTDGDNVQWLQGNFFHHPSYWADRDRGRVPFGWSTCFAQLIQLSPAAIDYAFATRSTNDSFVEWGGGYYYPDHFAADRKDRWDLLAQHAQRTWSLMKKTNTRIIGFNVAKYDSPDARKAYEVFARQTDGLLGIIAFQYAPYEAGAGHAFWVKDRGGTELPVITTRYAIWENSNDRPRAGTPAKIAREIRDTIQNSASNRPRYDWVITHAWSYFKKAPGPDENAENVSQAEAAAKGLRGYTPVTWCAERLPDSIRVVSPEELLLRIRMQHNPTQTKQFLNTLN